MNRRINEKLGAWLIIPNNTKKELARHLGMSKPTLYTRLSGATKWTWDEVVAIANLTNSTLDELAGIAD